MKSDKFFKIVLYLGIFAVGSVFITFSFFIPVAEKFESFLRQEMLGMAFVLSSFVFYTRWKENHKDWRYAGSERVAGFQLLVGLVMIADAIWLAYKHFAF